MSSSAYGEISTILYIEVDDTALAIVKFKSGAIGNIIVSNSQKPGLYGKGPCSR